MYVLRAAGDRNFLHWDTTALWLLLIVIKKDRCLNFDIRKIEGNILLSGSRDIAYSFRVEFWIETPVGTDAYFENYIMISVTRSVPRVIRLSTHYLRESMWTKLNSIYLFYLNIYNCSDSPPTLLLSDSLPILNFHIKNSAPLPKIRAELPI